MEVSEECVIANVLRDFVIIYVKSFGLVRLVRERWEQSLGNEFRLGAVHFVQLTIWKDRIKIFHIGKQICRYEVFDGLFEFEIRPRHCVNADPFSYDGDHVHFGKVLVPASMPDVSTAYIRARFSDHLVPEYSWLAVQFYDGRQRQFVNLTNDSHSDLIGSGRRMPTEDEYEQRTENSYYKKDGPKYNDYGYDDRASRDPVFDRNAAGTHQLKSDFNNRRGGRTGSSQETSRRNNRKAPIYFEYNGRKRIVEAQADEESDEEIRREFTQNFAIIDECSLKFPTLNDDDIIRDDAVGLVEKSILVISIEARYSIGLIVPEGNSYAQINYYSIDKGELKLGHVYKGSGNGIKNSPFTVSITNIANLKEPESEWEYATKRRNTRFIFEVTFNDMAFERVISKSPNGMVLKTQIGNVLLDNDCIEASRRLGENQKFKVQAQHIQIDKTRKMEYAWHARYDTVCAI